MTDLPEGWRGLTLADVAKWGSGGTPKAGNSSYYGGAIPWAVIGDLDDDVVRRTKGSITDEGLQNSSAKLVEPGTLLVAMYGSIGKLGVAGTSMATNQAIAFAIPDASQTSTAFLFHFLASQRAALGRSGKGATQQNISQTILKAWPVPIPPLDEQEEIVRILDTQLARLDSVLGAVQAVRDKADQFRRSLLHAAFTGQLTQPDPNRTTDLPEGWRSELLGELAQMSLGKMLDKKSATGEHPMPYLRNINVRWGSVDLDDVQQMDIRPEELERVAVRSGDVVVCEGGEPGRCAVWHGEPMAIQKALHRIRPGEGLRSSFLALGLESEFRGRSAHALFTGTTIKHLPKDKLRSLAVPVPPVDEQEEIVRILDMQLARLDGVLGVADRVELECGRLRRSLLQAAFTGELTKEWRAAHG